MSNKIEVKVPDIGDFKDVPIIEVAVQAGDTVKVDQTLIVLESDKASMDVPSSAAGVVREVKIKVGDKADVHYLLRIADSCLILSQRLGEWCGHGPILEEDLALMREGKASEAAADFDRASRDAGALRRVDHLLHVLRRQRQNHPDAGDGAPVEGPDQHGRAGR